jgi:hypothetical protein
MGRLLLIALLLLTPTLLRAQAPSGFYCKDTSVSANTITCTTYVVFAYFPGMSVDVLIANSVTGATTINVNAIGSKAVTYNGSTTMATGIMVAGGTYRLTYNGTAFIMQGSVPAGNVGTVTSVGFTGGIISVANATSTPAFTLAGTSGGVPYFSSATTWASSAAGTLGHLMLWGGAGAAPTDGGAPPAGATSNQFYCLDSSVTVNLITCAPSTPLASYAAGQSIDVKVANSTTAATNINVSGLGNKAVWWGGGTLPTQSGGNYVLQAGGVYRLTYDGTEFQVQGYTPMSYIGSIEAVGAMAIPGMFGANVPNGLLPSAFATGTAAGTPTNNMQANNAAGNSQGQNLVYQGGNDLAYAAGVTGAGTFRGADNPSTNGSAANGAGNALYRGGNNSGTNAASIAGNIQTVPGASIGAATRGLQGLALHQVVYVKGATVTKWNLECQSAAMTVADCAASPSNWVGVAELVNTNTVQTTFEGQTPVNASAAVTLGHTVCAGSTAGQVTDSGITGPCPASAGLTVGIVIATAGAWTLPDASTFTATTTLPVIQIWTQGPIATTGTATNCADGVNNPAVCGSASAGAVIIAAAATTVTVNTTAVTANSEIFLMYDSSLGTRLSVTCNTVEPGLYGVTARTPGTSFTITATAPITNPVCLTFLVVN